MNMTKKLMIGVSILLLVLLTQMIGCAGSYPTINKVVSELISIYEDNKENPEEAKKLIKELIQANEAQLQQEGEALKKVLAEEMKTMAGDPNTNPDEKDVEALKQKSTRLISRYIADYGKWKTIIETDPQAQQIMLDARKLFP